MKIIIHTYSLKLKHPFAISRRSWDTQPTLIVELQSDGFFGLGEATSNPYYNITVDSMRQHLESVIPFIESCKDQTPEEFWNNMSTLFKNDKFILCALDEAYNDLYAKKNGKKLYELWGSSSLQNPKTNYTIGIDTLDKMVMKLKEMPWPIYKIKLGTQDDIAIISELRKHTDAVFRIDANCGWTVSETINNAIALKKMGVEFIEQPIKANLWAEHKEVFKHSVLPIIADESCIEEEDISKCHNHFHGVNIKLVKCGGLTPARRMIAKAKSYGMKTMVGCMTESSVGISAIAHLLPELDYVDMDGALLLSQDIATGVTITDGIIYYTNSNGIGAILHK